MTGFHIFLIISSVISKPIVADLYDHTFSTMEACKAYVEANPKAIKDHAEEMRPFIGIPDGAPYSITYGCRGKNEIDT